MAKRVDAGIAFLNVVRPGWVRKIDLDKLDLSSPKTCVIGEVLGDYYRGRSSLGLSADNGRDSAHKAVTKSGSEITLPIALGFAAKTNYPLLTRIWKIKIRGLLKRS